MRHRSRMNSFGAASSWAVTPCSPGSRFAPPTCRDCPRRQSTTAPPTRRFRRLRGAAEYPITSHTIWRRTQLSTLLAQWSGRSMDFKLCISHSQNMLACSVRARPQYRRGFQWHSASGANVVPCGTLATEAGHTRSGFACRRSGQPSSRPRRRPSPRQSTLSQVVAPFGRVRRRPRPAAGDPPSACSMRGTSSRRAGRAGSGRAATRCRLPRSSSLARPGTGQRADDGGVVWSAG